MKRTCPRNTLLKYWSVFKQRIQNKDYNNLNIKKETDNKAFQKTIKAIPLR